MTLDSASDVKPDAPCLRRPACLPASKFHAGLALLCAAGVKVPAGLCALFCWRRRRRRRDAAASGGARGRGLRFAPARGADAAQLTHTTRT